MTSQEVAVYTIVCLQFVLCAIKVTEDAVGVGVYRGCCWGRGLPYAFIWLPLE